MPDEGVRALVQEQCGMTLLPGSYQIAAWWHGAAGSGKSTLAECVEGIHNKVARLDLATLGDTFALEGILGSQLILVDEVECEKWKEGTFKTLVSGNGIGINRKHLSVLNYHSKKVQEGRVQLEGSFDRPWSDGRSLAVAVDVLGRTTRLIVRAGGQPRLSPPAVCVRGVGRNAVASDISEAHPCK